MKMKRLGAIISMALIMVMMVSMTAFAAGSFQVEKTYPTDGSKGKSVDNFSIKVNFTEPVSSAANNAKCVIVKDAEGNKLPVSLYYNPKDEHQMMALVEPENKSLVKQNMEYTVTITKDFQSAAGETLGQDYVVSFTTLNQTRTNTVNMLMMAVMFGGIMIFSTRAMKKEPQKEATAKKGNDTVNPYKVAKETGKSVEEVVAKDQKDKAKKAAAEAKKAAKDQALKDRIMEEMEEEAEKEAASGVKHVKGPRPISAGGSTYKPGQNK